MTKVFQILTYLFILFILWILIEAQVFRVRKTKIKNVKIPKCILKINPFKSQEYIIKMRATHNEVEKLYRD